MISPAVQVSNWHDLEGHIVERRYNLGFVILSIIISYIGSWTTLELIHKRTFSRGWYNWWLLIGASISMGGIATFSMHFVASRAIVLGDGIPQIQLTYAAGFIALSFFVPILVTLAAFTIINLSDRIVYYRLVIAGTLIGSGYCSMHFIGQLAITNYNCTYVPAYIVGASIIAIVVSIFALGAFFLLRSTWSTTWWKRALCAIILTCAVSGMHWVAAISTRYRLKGGPKAANTKVRSVTTIVVSIITFIDCIMLFALNLRSHYRRLRAANRARQVVLATVIFDNEDHLLVTSEGNLPSRKITESDFERGVNDVFDIAHPAFHWMFRTSRHWSGVTDLIVPMQEHLQRMGLQKHIGAEPDIEFVDESGEPTCDSYLIFRELFCIAAADLANHLGQRLEEIGMMFDKIIYTGQMPEPQRDSAGRSIDLEGHETAPQNRGKGQLLFLVQDANREQAERLQAAGYRFTTTEKVVPLIAATFQITPGNLTRQIADMRNYATVDRILEPGVYLGMFAIKASIGASFNVLARKDARNLLPTIQLPFDVLEVWQLDFLSDMEDFSVTTCLVFLREACRTEAAARKVLASQLLTALLELQDKISDTTIDDARLILKPVHVPCRVQTQNPTLSRAAVLTFRIIVPLGSRATGKHYEYVPLSFFTMQQHVIKDSADHAIFARKTFREFAPSLYPADVSNPIRSTKSKFWRRHSSVDGDARVIAEEAEIGSADSHPAPQSNNVKGAIVEEIPSAGRASLQDMDAGDNKAQKKSWLLNYTPKYQHVGRILKSLGVEVVIEDNSRFGSAADRRKLAAIGMLEGGEEQTGLVSTASKEVDSKSFVDELIRVCVKSRKSTLDTKH